MKIGDRFTQPFWANPEKTSIFEIKSISKKQRYRIDFAHEFWKDGKCTERIEKFSAIYVVELPKTIESLFLKHPDIA